ncbi:DUF4190 domain-containing protein [Nonomuraea sp. B5E05]|uniref:DUF4190 domain-containing protein n=1 Tax=Nonomuraea sp. B5E05 TaxID=3153569 RepID=UPI003260B3D8
MTTPGDPDETRRGQDPHEGRPEEGAPRNVPPQHEPEWWREGTLEEEERRPALRPYEPGPTGGDRPPEERSAGGPGAGPTGGAAPDVPEPAGGRTGGGGAESMGASGDFRNAEPEGPGRQGEDPGPRGEGAGEEGEEPIAPAPPIVPRPDVPPTHEPRPVGEPRHPDLPTSPEVPQPTGGDAEETQAFPIPGGTPPYPGWTSTPSEGERPGRPAPSRYEQGDDQPGFEPPGGGAPGGPPSPEGGTPAREGRPTPEGRGGREGWQGQEGPGGTPYQAGGTPRDDEPTVPGTVPSSPYGGPPGYGPGPESPYGMPGAGYQQAKPGSGLATASLVLGVASPFLVFVCFTGVITAILSIVFGGVALAKRAGKGRAIAGIVLSVLSLILFAIVAIWLWNVAQECAGLPSDLADRCFESQFPWMGGGR